VYEDAIPIGTLTLQDSDVVVWGERPPDAFYVHGLAIRRVVGGRGVGAHMLEWVAQQVIATGKSYLRLDCWAENQALRAYYERIGFTFCGRRDFPNGWSCGLYEKKLA
jgi:ribosomal protein S18 acetylase RimI-like enzyme